MIATQRVEAGNGDFRETEIDGRSDAGVEAVDEGVHTCVDGEDGLPETVVAKSGFVGEAIRNGIDPAKAADLGARFCLGLPDGLQDRNVALGLQAVTNKVVAAEGLAVVEMVVHFNQTVVLTIFIGKANLQIGRGTGVGWIVFQQTKAESTWG